MATKVFVKNQYVQKLVSQGGRDTKVHVCLPYPGAISFYVYIVPSGLISIFLDVECDKISSNILNQPFFE